MSEVKLSFLVSPPKDVDPVAFEKLFLLLWGFDNLPISWQEIPGRGIVVSITQGVPKAIGMRIREKLDERFPGYSIENFGETS